MTSSLFPLSGSNPVLKLRPIRVKESNLEMVQFRTPDCTPKAALQGEPDTELIEAVFAVRPPVIREKKKEADEEQKYEVVANASTLFWFRRLGPSSKLRAGPVNCMLVEEGSLDRNLWRVLGEWAIPMVLGELTGRKAAEVRSKLKGTRLDQFHANPNVRADLKELIGERRSRKAPKS
jgi:hypothetical protein